MEGHTTERIFPQWGFSKLWISSGTGPYSDEGRNTQPPNRNCTVSRRLDRGRWRNPDEGATGKGEAQSRADRLQRFEQRIPNLPQPWENVESKPVYIASPLDIMLRGRSAGRHSTTSMDVQISVAIFAPTKRQSAMSPASWKCVAITSRSWLPADSATFASRTCSKGTSRLVRSLIVLGGPAMLIGLGGGAASSMASGSGSEDLDFASVQRENAEMERRCQRSLTAAGSWVTESDSVYPRCGAGGCPMRCQSW